MRERILQIIEYYSLNKNKFYLKTGFSNGFLDKVGNIGVDKFQKILDTFPEINPLWLLNGEGDMLKEGISVSDAITINDNNGVKTVSARELHKFLEATERFQSWFDRQLTYGFDENIDYVGCEYFNTLAKQTLKDYALTLDCAKEISMIQKNIKGKQARQYFIECEKKSRGIIPPPIHTPNLPTIGKVPETYREALLLAADQQLQLEQKDEQIKKLEP